jgi:hypothetical protein
VSTAIGVRIVIYLIAFFVIGGKVFDAIHEWPGRLFCLMVLVVAAVDLGRDEIWKSRVDENNGNNRDKRRDAQALESAKHHWNGH